MSALPRARAWSTTNGHAAAAATTTTSTTTASSSTAAKPPAAAAGPPPTSSPFPRPPGAGAATTATTSVSTEQKKHTTHVTTLTQHHHHRDHLLYRAPSSAAARARSRSSSTGTVDNDNEGDGDGNDEPVVVAAPTFLQPRVAAVLGVSRRWHPVLFSLRLLSIVPGIILSFPMIIRFLLMLHAFATSPPDRGDAGTGTGTTGGDHGHDHTLLGSAGRSAAPDRLLLTETMLAILWCGCSGYLSFYFTDCLMSRWLINYTPPATAFRLVSVSALNGYLQSWTVHLSGSTQDPFLLLPTWVTITSTLTLVYHIIHRKINIRKEMSTSISVFSMASYVSLLALLIQQHWARTDWLELPFIALACQVVKGGGEVVVRVAQYANISIEPRAGA